MKKWKILLGLATSFVIVQTTAFAANECTKEPIYDNSCPSDSTFYGKLRFEEKYGLNDEFYARGGTNQILGLKYQIKEQCDYNNSDVEIQKDSNFFYTTEDLNGRKGVLPAREDPYRIITSNDYEIRKLPPKRDDHNLLVKYIVKYNVNGGQEKTHTECKYYAITWCGDGVVDKPGKDDKWEAEICDPADPNHVGWGDGGCDNTCKPVKKAVCSSDYNGKKLDTLTEGNHLCTEGTYSEFYEDKINHKWTWKCKNKLGNGVDCSATQPYCGDGNVDKGEQCDPKDSKKTNWGNGGCDEVSCTPIKVGDPVCNSKYNGQRLKDLTEGNSLCTEGTYSEFGYNSDLHKWTWKCKNKLGNGVDCSANKPFCGDGIPDEGEECDGSSDCSPECKKMYCGDGIRNNGEQCDPKDSTKAGRGPKGCNEFCEPEFDSDVSCTQTFKKTLRCGSTEKFPDDFKAGGTDRWMYDYNVTFEPEKGYNINGGLKPTFGWTQTLKNANMLVKAGQQMRIIEAEEAYLIKNCPKKRSYENLYMEYLVVSAGEDYAGKKLPNSKLSSHKECVYYEISWCGDGILDTNYGEECDPGSAGTSTLSDGRTCNSECKIESPKGTAVIEKTLKDKIEVTYTGQELTWNVKVTASGGNVTNFEIWDKMPIELDYVNWELNKANTQNGIDVKYSNRKPNPKSSGEVNIHYWDVTGTLYSGNSITMSIKTKVNKMPGAGENIVNIACVIKDNKEIDCGGDEPPKTEGYLVPDKTIIGTKEVKSTGDIIKWSLKVYAKGGNVKDPVIQDVLPSVLGYSGYKITHNPGLSIYTPTIGTVVEGGVDVETIEWKVIGTLEKNDYIEIELTTYAKKMPEKDYDNVLCARPKDKPADKKCDKEPIPAPKLWIKKYIMDGTNKIKEKTVKIGDEIVYRIEFGNKGTASATITSIKDFLPKNVGYRSSEVYVGGTKVNTEVVENTQKGELTLITNKYKVVDGVHIDIFGGLTLKPDTEGYIIIKGEILTGNQNNRTNFACIYLNDKKPDNDIVDGERCDSVVHNFGTGLLCSKPEITNKSFTSAGGSTEVVCKASGGQKADSIELDCGNGKIFTGSNIPSLTGTCVYPSNSTTSSISYPVVCKVNGKTDDICKDTVSIPGQSSPGCFPVGTKVTMADGTKKNIEEVKEGDMVLSYNTERNVNEGNVVKQRIVHENNVHEMYELTINGKVLKVTDVHPFYVRKSEDPRDYAWVEAQNLKVGDILLMSDGSLVDIEKINHYHNQETVYNLEVEGNHDYFVDEGYLVHNKGTPSCDKITTNPETLESGKDIEVTCKTSNGSAYILIDCNYKSTNKYDGTNKGNTYFESDGRKTEFKATCKKYQLDAKIQCLVKDDSSSKWENITANTSSCQKEKTSGSTCFPAGTKVIMEDGTKKNIEEVKEGDMVLSYNTDTNTNELSVVEQRIIHEDSEHEMYELTINGNVLKATDVHPFYVRKSVSSREYDWIEAKNLKVGDILLMKDGSLVEIERIEHYPNKETVYNLEVEGNHNYYVAEGYLVHNKGGGTNSGGGGHTPTQPIYNSTNCVDVNANQLSYEQGEVLAFYWNIKDLSGGVGEWAYEFTSPTKAYPATIDVASGIIKNKINQPCTGLDGRIALDSMVCYFEIKDPDGNVVAKKTAPCLQRENTPISPALLSGWMNAGIERITKTSDRGKTFYWSYHTKDTTGELRSNLNYITNFGVDLTKFGEYKVKLSKITYLQCKNEKWQDVYTGGNCEIPFVLTNPYTVQKTPSGNLKASTEALSNYKYCEKYEKITSTNDIPKCLSWNTANNLLNAIAVSEYQPNDAVNGAMTKFINKYSKLAVKAGDGLKKVPGKNIYFVSSDICLGSQCEKSIDVSKPTTVVQTEGYNTKIKGNVNSNLMLLTKGKITFTDSKSCNNRQVVKGIFYAENGIERTRVTKNTSDRLNEAQRCTEGGLTVKGVLIGRGLDGVMKNSRSNLNKWFSGKNAQTVMNGASVIIEYSPSVFTKGTMPPGAEDFTTALSIYKD